MEIKSTPVKQTSFLQILEHFIGMPSTLYYIGTIPSERAHSVAIVGSRRPTHYGKQVTYDFSYDLAQKGIVIISGLAFGIDAQAHRGALDAGGITIAILAGGLDSIYPASHIKLAREIVEKGGALISEYPPGTSTKKFQFLARNRLISGLADAVVITEAAERSGALSTISHALDQNKEVFAVPGNITSVLSVGPNKLLRQGAQPILESSDILEVIAPRLIHTDEKIIIGSTSLENQIIALLKQGVSGSEMLQQQIDEEVSTVLSALTTLEINSVIYSIGPNEWALCQG